SLGISLLILYTRKEKWISLKIKVTLLIIMTITSFIGFIFSNDNATRFLFYSMIVPPISFSLDRLFKILSMILYNRDFYLYLRGSREINDSFSGLGVNKHIKGSDIIFSFGILITILILTVLGAVLFGKDNWFEKLMK
ncbi:MAG: hypothetical protein Q8K69_00505, partial [Bacteroidota bacterium]|nr:hypothetical protein [Bacteroidota bacterium]